jgi:oligopeptide/dipeptide ABC transporter ATP-binding protein
MSEPAALEVREVSKSFPLRRGIRALATRAKPPAVVALDRVSVALPRGQTLGIVGESGSGKSTLAKAIVRLVEPDSGEIVFDGQDVLGLGRRPLTEVRRRVQLIYQDPYASLNPRLAIGDAVTEPAQVHGLMDGRDRSELAAELLRSVGLGEGLRNRRPRGLSGGQRQRVAIARALAARPEILIADEAVSALDVSVQAQILNLLTDLRARLGLSMIFIAHQLSVVSYVADRTAVMYLGAVVEEGPTRSVFAEPAHPYTAGLLEAQPGAHRRARRTKPAVTGEIPSALALPSGCRFRTRCPLAQPVCAEVDPPAVEVDSGHRSRCHVLPKLRLEGAA